MFPVQQNHKNNLLTTIRKWRHGLDASITGAGKTLVACTVAKELDMPALVVCPKVSIPMWERELGEQGCDYYDVVNYEKLRTGKLPYGEWAATNIWQWNVPEDTFVIFDECQRCKGMNSQNARMMWAAKKLHSLSLSATAAKDPTEMKALGYLLGLHSLRDFWKWCYKHGCRKGMFGGLRFQGTHENINNLHKLIFPEYGSRLTYADLAEYFQATEIITTPLDFGNELKEVYEAMEKELDELADREAGDSTQAEVLTIRLRARQKVELLKVPYMVEKTLDFLEEGRSIVLFVNFTQTLEALRERLSSVCDVGIIAGIDIKNRQKYIDAFADDKLRVMICNVQAGGVSVNLHDRHGNHPRVSILSPSDNEKDVLQCVGRIHRFAGATPTQQYILFAAGTIEEDVEKNCRQKMDQIEIFNEGLDTPDEFCQDGSTKKWQILT